ncbi:MAG: hypothetical protein IKZ93_00635 [Prevotella sp.]|nr:hypothetical protein [Prevotella sp.]
MKHLLLTTILLLATLTGVAQQITPSLTVYPEFRPATILLTNGSKLKVPLANIFLKNSSLLYMSDDVVKEAELKNVLQVQFDDRTYLRIDSLLAYQVDSVGRNALYCAKVIDIKSYKQTIANSANITNLDLSNITNMLSFSTIDAIGKEGVEFPVIPLYYFRLDNQFVRVHERNLKRVLSKEKQRIMESVMSLPDFSWTDEPSLMKMLEMLK